MASRPKLYEASWYKRMKHPISKPSNSKPTKSHNVDDEMLGNVSFNLNSRSKTELKQLKDKFISKIQSIQSFVKQIEARELELVRLEDVNSKKNLGQKRVVPVTPDPQNKRRRLVKTNSNETLKDVEMRKCGVILEKLMNHKDGWVFNEPVDVVGLGLADYHRIVKRPMDLGTVKLKLDIGLYENSLDFADDVRLTFQNARLYNGEGDDVYTMATVLLHMFHRLFDSTNHKFEAEVQSVIVEQHKFRKPLGEITKSQLVSSQHNVEKPVQIHPLEGLPKKNTVSEQQIRTLVLPEAKENPPMRKEMSDLERDWLGRVLQDFGDKYVVEILQIVANRNSNYMTTPDGDEEIELDMEALDSETMWDLHTFCTLKLKAEDNNKAI
ncbi:hypothetical protein POM88_005880 [Heracleum sosnowskyi]|uniref:Uncharacterized protein n=1 Tax=Heracleum sosnowskyi TaxID=360622 RepID=A0AAD8N4S2_9APIA|nr:hypothetical protein POM88_005880 [Heracleum sosnowskyi]